MPLPEPSAVSSLRPFFRPRAVAVVGASRDPMSVGYRLLDAVVTNDFRGPVYPVNPKAAEVRGLRAYPSVRDLPGPVDLALVAVPRDAVLGVVEDCAARGVPAVVVVSAGFAEAGDEGRRLQQRLAEAVRRHGMRLIGPNCLGVLTTDPEVRLNGLFASVVPPPGRVAMSSDSGALGLAVLAAAARLDVGMSAFVSVGNRADVSSNDLLEHWEHDDRTGVVLLYLESFGNPRRFARIARRVSRRKPVVAVKAGKTRAGRRAAGSHTAALAASDVAVEALFHQTGVIRAETLEEMFDLAAALDDQGLPKGRRLAVVTNAGGPAILCADAGEAGGLVLPELSPATQQRLASFLSPAAAVANPIDMLAAASSEQYRRAVETVLGSGEVDALIVIHVAAGLATAEAVSWGVTDGVAGARKAGATQPVLVCWMPEAAPRALEVPGGEKLPCYAFPEAPARVLGKVAAHAEWRAQPPGEVRDFADADTARARQVCEAALRQRGPGWLSAEEARAVLGAAGLPAAPGGVARSADAAAALAGRLGFPVAVKLASREIVHKTEVGGVRLDLPDEAAVRRAFDEIRARLEREGRLGAMEGVLVQPMLAGGTEVMVGVTQDPLFGPLIAFGLGGIHVEILGDVCFRVTPLTDRDAAEMVRSVRGYRLFEGYRGHAPADVPALEEVLLRVSRLVEEVPEIGELDLNPVFALPPGQGCRVADARILVRPERQRPGV
jgi:acetyl coenzyme A synthetase (ADP forming)-like protein